MSERSAGNTARPAKATSRPVLTENEKVAIQRFVRQTTIQEAATFCATNSVQGTLTANTEAHTRRDVRRLLVAHILLLIDGGNTSNQISSTVRSAGLPCFAHTVEKTVERWIALREHRLSLSKRLERAGSSEEVEAPPRGFGVAQEHRKPGKALVKKVSSGRISSKRPSRRPASRSNARDAGSAVETDEASAKPEPEAVAARPLNDPEPKVKPKAKRLKRGDAALKIIAALESLAGKGIWNAGEHEIVQLSGVARSTYYHVSNNSEAVQRARDQYESRRLGRGPLRAKDQ